MTSCYAVTRPLSIILIYLIVICYLRLTHGSVWMVTGSTSRPMNRVLLKKIKVHKKQAQNEWKTPSRNPKSRKFVWLLPWLYDGFLCHYKEDLFCFKWCFIVKESKMRLATGFEQMGHL